MSDVWVISNETAGSARRGNSMPEWAEREDVEFHGTRTAGDAGRLARLAVTNGVRRIVVAGGDGTINEVVNGLAPEFAAEIGVVPLGTGNDLARSLGLTTEDVGYAFRHACHGAATRIDVVHVEHVSPIRREAYFVNMATGGFGGVVAADVTSAAKATWGAFAYWITALSEVGRLCEYDVTLTLDGVVIRESIYDVAVANGRYVGGGFPLAPKALLDDGLLDVVIVPVQPIPTLVGAGTSYLLGWDQGTTGVRSIRGSRLEMRAEPALPLSIDGERATDVAAIFEVWPSALSIVAGPRPVAMSDS